MSSVPTGRRRWGSCSSTAATAPSPLTAITRSGCRRSPPAASSPSTTSSPTRPTADGRRSRSIRGPWSRACSTTTSRPGAARCGCCAAGHNPRLGAVERSAMAVKRLNHAVLYVSDVDRAVKFYEEALGFQVITKMGGAAFMKAPGSDNDHDLGLFELGAGAGPSQAGRSTVGLYHLAWEVDTLNELERVRDALASAGALAGASDHGTTKSLYGKDPDGLEFEIVWLIPADLLDDSALAARKRIGPLDLEKEKTRYGADAPGGIGISRLAPA